MELDPIYSDAIDYVLYWEDTELSGKVTTDGGGKTRFGLSQRAHPSLNDGNFYVLPTAKALVKAKEVYVNEYCVPAQLEKIFDPSVRNKVLDMFINMGREGIMLAQQAVGLKQDGGVGPKTLNGWNSCAADALVWKLANLSLTHYSLLDGSADEHASWKKRAQCLGKIGVNMTLGLGGPKPHEQVLVSK